MLVAVALTDRLREAECVPQESVLHFFIKEGTKYQPQTCNLILKNCRALSRRCSTQELRLVLYKFISLYFGLFLAHHARCGRSLMVATCIRQDPFVRLYVRVVHSESPNLVKSPDSLRTSSATPRWMENCVEGILQLMTKA